MIRKSPASDVDTGRAGTVLKHSDDSFHADSVAVSGNATCLERIRRNRWWLWTSSVPPLLWQEPHDRQTS